MRAPDHLYYGLRGMVGFFLVSENQPPMSGAFLSPGEGHLEKFELALDSGHVTHAYYTGEDYGLVCFRCGVNFQWWRLNIRRHDLERLLRCRGKLRVRYDEEINWKLEGF